MNKALGLIEAIGMTAAIAAVDAACKSADVTLIGVEKIIGVETLVGVNIQLAGEVSAVNAAVEAGVVAARRVGMVASSKVIARPHDEVDKLIEKFSKNLKSEERHFGEKKEKAKEEEKEEVESKEIKEVKKKEEKVKK
nr:BMC domain-containing protein [Tissierella sp.]